MKLQGARWPTALQCPSSKGGCRCFCGRCNHRKFGVKGVRHTFPVVRLNQVDHVAPGRMVREDIYGSLWPDVKSVRRLEVFVPSLSSSPA